MFSYDDIDALHKKPLNFYQYKIDNTNIQEKIDISIETPRLPNPPPKEIAIQPQLKFPAFKPTGKIKRKNNSLPKKSKKPKLAAPLAVKTVPAASYNFLISQTQINAPSRQSSGKRLSTESRPSTFKGPLVQAFEYLIEDKSKEKITINVIDVKNLYGSHLVSGKVIETEIEKIKLGSIISLILGPDVNIEAKIVVSNPIIKNLKY
ncbi:unnamed protein product [Blepharisma stoltei]|uniref:Uncharacterized protein n=1 Tax=Blepharisma stoltei TaxID=1481888 RepID=A0AAU9I937_9CILI|nr:unnamed protein product [Blepharisma stoltei]